LGETAFVFVLVVGLATILGDLSLSIIAAFDVVEFEGK
jgi:hypothetical protein